MPKTTTDYNRLPLTDWFYSIEHSKLSPGWYIHIYIYIPDSTYYKSTASGANNKAGLVTPSKWLEGHLKPISTFCWTTEIHIWMKFEIGAERSMWWRQVNTV